MTSIHYTRRKRLVLAVEKLKRKDTLEQTKIEEWTGMMVKYRKGDLFFYEEERLWKKISVILEIMDEEQFDSIGEYEDVYFLWAVMTDIFRDIYRRKGEKETELQT